MRSMDVVIDEMSELVDSMKGRLMVGAEQYKFADEISELYNEVVGLIPTEIGDAFLLDLSSDLVSVSSEYDDQEFGVWNFSEVLVNSLRCVATNMSGGRDKSTYDVAGLDLVIKTLEDAIELYELREITHATLMESLLIEINNLEDVFSDCDEDVVVGASLYSRYDVLSDIGGDVETAIYLIQDFIDVLGYCK